MSKLGNSNDDLAHSATSTHASQYPWRYCTAMLCTIWVEAPPSDESVDKSFEPHVRHPHQLIAEGTVCSRHDTRKGRIKCYAPGMQATADGEWSVTRALQWCVASRLFRFMFGALFLASTGASFEQHCATDLRA